MEWEYKVLNLDSGFLSRVDKIMEAYLNDYGSNGWELISSIPMLETEDGNENGQVEVREISLILKRPK